jgi:predicted nuclease of predicted toxin-antitoxin system
MRFLVDMNLATEVAAWLRGQGHDAVHLREAGLQELGDAAVLAKAVAERRVVLTFDLDFADISAAATEAGAAVVLFRLRSAQTTHIIDRLRTVLASAAAQALETGAVVIVEPTRLRVRRLPIGD